MLQLSEAARSSAKPTQWRHVIQKRQTRLLLLNPRGGSMLNTWPRPSGRTRTVSICLKSNRIPKDEFITISAIPPPPPHKRKSITKFQRKTIEAKCITDLLKTAFAITDFNLQQTRSRYTEVFRNKMPGVDCISKNSEKVSMDHFRCITFSLIMTPREHKQKKWINMVIQFPLFVSSKPHCQAEIYFENIENGLFIRHWLDFITKIKRSSWKGTIVQRR